MKKNGVHRSKRLLTALAMQLSTSATIPTRLQYQTAGFLTLQKPLQHSPQEGENLEIPRAVLPLLTLSYKALPNACASFWIS